MGFDLDLNQLFEISTTGSAWTTDGSHASRNRDVKDSADPRALFPVGNNEDDHNNNKNVGNPDDVNNNKDDENDPAEQENHVPGPTNQEMQLPLANVTRIMRCSLPLDARVTSEARKSVQDCVFRFIRHVTKEATEYCRRDCRVTITAEDVIQTMKNTGFHKYVEPLNLYLKRYRESMISEHAPEPIEDQSGKSHDFADKSELKGPAAMEHDLIQGSWSDMEGVIGHDANKMTRADKECDKEGAMGRGSIKKTVPGKQDVKRCDVIAIYRPNKQGKMILHSTRKFRPDGTTAMKSDSVKMFDLNGPGVTDHDSTKNYGLAGEDVMNPHSSNKTEPIGAATENVGSQQDVSGPYVDDYFQGYVFLDNSSGNNSGSRGGSSSQAGVSASDHHDQFRTWLKNKRARFM